MLNGKKKVIPETRESWSMLTEIIIILYSNAEGHDYKKEFRGGWMQLETGCSGFKGHTAVN